MFALPVRRKASDVDEYCGEIQIVSLLVSISINFQRHHDVGTAKSGSKRLGGWLPLGMFAVSADTYFCCSQQVAVETVTMVSLLFALQMRIYNNYEIITTSAKYGWNRKAAEAAMYLSQIVSWTIIQLVAGVSLCLKFEKFYSFFWPQLHLW